jgi:Ca2+-binding RTX toxin-like protein
MTDPVLAFAGAEGYGANATGGRGGRVLHVTTLADTGTGSLRWALSQSGPRTIVFDVAGSIKLASQILVENGDVTIAGQSAPGEGITIEGSRIRLKASNIIVRGLHFRPGDGDGMKVGDRDGMMIGTTDYAQNNVIIDHNSFTWGIDENFDVNGNIHNLTISNNIIAEGLSHSLHPNGEHSKGLLVSNWEGLNGSTDTNISIIKNLMSSNMERNPEVKAGQNVEVLNNYVYDYGHEFRVMWFGGGNDGTLLTSIKAVGNVITPGPGTNNDVIDPMYLTPGYSAPSTNLPMILNPMAPGSELYLADNVWTKLPTDSAGNQDQNLLYWDNGGIGFLVDHASFGSGAKILDSSATAAYVLANAGTSGYSANSVDARIIRDAATGGGTLIDSTAQVGGMPSATGYFMTAAPDTDRDGMPDWFEDKYGFNKLVDDSNGDTDKDGYTNVEEYLNGIITGFDVNTGDLSQEYVLPLDRSGPVLRGTAGNDTFTVRTLGAWLEETATGGVDSAVSYVDFRLSDNVENLSLKGAQAVYGTGNALDNKIVGTEFDNRLAGLDGNDTLRGLAGNDRLNGGAGSDRLEGNEGDDVLMGGKGVDTLYGGTGADTFRFAAGDSGLGDKGPEDLIADFDAGDRLMLPGDTTIDIRTMNSVTTSGKTYAQAKAAADANFASFGGGPLLVKGASDSFVFWSDGSAGTLNQGVLIKGLSAGNFGKLG